MESRDDEVVAVTGTPEAGRTRVKYDGPVVNRTSLFLPGRRRSAQAEKSLEEHGPDQRTLFEEFVCSRHGNVARVD